MPHYKIQPCQPFSPEVGRKLLAMLDSGREGIPARNTIQNDQQHQAIAERCAAVADNLGITPRSSEDGVRSDSQSSSSFSLPRAWVGDYRSNTYLDMFVRAVRTTAQDCQSR